MKKSILKTLRIAYQAISILLITAIIALTLLATLLGVSGMDRQNPKSIFGLRAFIVLSDSMTPTFGEGSLIIVFETKAENLVTDDIVTYAPIVGDETLLTHRIVRIADGDAGKLITTRGDANNVDDKEIEAAQILGKTIFYMDGLGTFIENLRTPLGMACMVAIIIVGLFIIPYLLNPSKKNRGKKRDIEVEETKTNEDGEVD